MMQKHDEVAKKVKKKKTTLITSLHGSGILKFSLKTFCQEALLLSQVKTVQVRIYTFLGYFILYTPSPPPFRPNINPPPKKPKGKKNRPK
jgi:hypothetical protein